MGDNSYNITVIVMQSEALSLVQMRAPTFFSRLRTWGMVGTLACGCMFAGSAMAIDVASQADWNTAAAAVAAAGAGSTVSINFTGGFTLTSSLALLQATNAGVTVNITGNGQTVDGATAFQGIQVDGANAPTVNISGLAITNTKAIGGVGQDGQAGYFSGGLSYGSGGGGGGGLGAGGGLFVGAGANVTISGVTFTGNNATGGAGGNGGSAQNAASSVTGGDGGVGGAANNGGAAGGGGAGGLGGNTGTQGTAGSAGTFGAGGGGGGGSGTTNSTSYTPNNAGGAGDSSGGTGGAGGDGVTNNNGSQGPGSDGGFGGAGGAGQGGAVYVATGGSLTVLDTAISGATVNGGAGGLSGIGQGPSSFNGTGGATGAASGAGMFIGTGVLANIGVTGGSVTYANVIGGAGGFNKTGAGTLILSATETYTGATNVNAGTLLVNGTLNVASTTTVGVAGILGGTGTVRATIVNGTLSPGNSIGTINTGNITFNAGSTYAVEVNAAGQSDKTQVTGTATINGGTVAVTAASGSYAPSTQYTILTSSGATTGAFSGATTNFAFLSPSLSYDANNVFLTLTVVNTSFAGFGTTPNQTATGAALDAAGSGGPYNSQLTTLVVGDVPGALDQLSGDGYAALKGSFIADSNYFDDAVNDRIDQAFDALEGVPPSGYAGDAAVDMASSGRSVWGAPFGGFSAISGNGNAASTASVAGGIVVGSDVKVGDWVVGIAGLGGYSSLSARNVVATSTDIGAGVYGGGEFGMVNLSLGLGYTHHVVRATRTVTLPGVSDTYRADYGVGTTQGFIAIGHDFQVAPATTMTPFGMVAAIGENAGAFTETGTGPGALTSAATFSTAIVTTLGLKAEHKVAFGDGKLVTLRGSVGWEHTFGNAPVAMNSFTGTGPFTVAAAPLPADAVALNLGANVDVGNGMMVSGSYDGRVATGGMSHGAKLTIAGQF